MGQARQESRTTVFDIVEFALFVSITILCVIVLVGCYREWVRPLDQQTENTHETLNELRATTAEYERKVIATEKLLASLDGNSGRDKVEECLRVLYGYVPENEIIVPLQKLYPAPIPIDLHE